MQRFASCGMVMRNAWRKCGATMALAFSTVVAAPAAFCQIPCSYTVEYLPNPPPCPFLGTFPIEPTDISPNGRYVCGWILRCSLIEQAAVIDTQTMQIIYIPIASGYVQSRAYAVNDKMEVACDMSTENFGLSRAFLWSNGQLIDLGLPPGATKTYGSAINNSTEITGECNPNRRAFVWKDGTFTILDLPIGPNAVARDIDQDGRVVGYMGGNESSSEAFFWFNSKSTSLGVIPEGYSAAAWAIAQNGTIAGVGYVSGGKFGYRRGFVWRNNEMHNIGTLPGFLQSYVWDTNNWVTIGECDNYPETGWAAFQYANGIMQKLDTLQPNPNLVLRSPAAISDDGAIVATGKIGSTHVRVVLRPEFGPPGDANGSCTVNVNDLLLVINDWGKHQSSADVNNDNIVNALDLLVVLKNWTGS